MNNDSVMIGNLYPMGESNAVAWNSCMQYVNALMKIALIHAIEDVQTASVRTCRWRRSLLEKLRTSLPRIIIKSCCFILLIDISPEVNKEEKSHKTFYEWICRIVRRNRFDMFCENENHVVNELQYFIFVYCFLFPPPTQSRWLIISLCSYYLNLVSINFL